MAALKFYKVLSLPGTLEPNAIYFVDLGSNFSIYVVDSAGILAHPISVPVHDQTSSTITDLGEAIDDRVAGLIQDNSGIIWTYDDGLGTLTPTLSGGGGYSDEQAQDSVGTILVDSSSVDFTYNDGTPSITAVVKPDGVTDVMLSDMPNNTIKGNNAGVTGDPLNLTASQIKDILAYTYSEVGAQPLDATLTALAGVSTTTDKLIYATGVDTFSTADFTTFGRSLVDDISAVAARNTLGLGVTDIVAFNSLVISGYLQLAIITVTTNTILDDTHHTVLCDTTGGSIVVTLPTAIGKAGRVYRIKKIDVTGNTITLNTTSAQNIDATTSRVVNVPYESVALQSNNSNWFVI